MVFMALLAPVIALSHTIFMTRIFVFRHAGSWTNQLRQSHAVPWRLAFKKLWPQMLAGCVIIAAVATKAPNDILFALLGSTGLILAVPFAVATASPFIGTLFARIGIGRIPEENETPAELLPLKLPAVEARAPTVPMRPLPRNV
jgi:membrane glycosyltransferase